jgi:hypothetical protein
MVADEAKLVTLATKLPVVLRERFEELAERRQLTESALLRRLVERELSGGLAEPVGEVEAAVAAELAQGGQSPRSARAAAALNLARRMDRDPTSGAANAGQLRHLLAELTPPRRALGFTKIAMLRLQRHLRRLGGWTIVRSADVPEDVPRFSIGEDWREEYADCVIVDDGPRLPSSRRWGRR